MTHHHHHHHHHTHDHDAPSALSFEEKMIKLLDHWTRHNDDHAANYREWAAKATAEGMAEVAALLDEAAEMTGKISDRFRSAIRCIHDEKEG